MTLLLLTYPLVPVRRNACGGTEQMAFLLLQHLASTPNLKVFWVGAAASQRFPQVEFISWPRLLAACGLPPIPASPIPQVALDQLLAHCRSAAHRLAQRLASSVGLDVIHSFGGLWSAELSGFPAPLLFTLHLSRSLYPAGWGRVHQSGLHLQCVSRSQKSDYGSAACCGVVANGINLTAYAPPRRPIPASAPLLYLGRICPEKAPHAAIAIARQARRKLWLVGGVAPFPSHRQYFRRAIAPHLNADIRWMPPPPFRTKRRLLNSAAALLLPSRIPETSSIVAMEAAASGLPVLAASVGSLPEIVQEGQTGFLGDDHTLARAVDHLSAISPAACRRWAEHHFPADRMCGQYQDLYRRLAAGVHH